MKTIGPAATLPIRMKDKGKSISSYNTKSQSEVPLPEVATKKRRLVLQSLKNQLRQGEFLLR